jgi:hypothetical protein
MAKATTTAAPANRSLERRTLPQARAKLRASRSDGKPTRIEGYAAVFYDGTPGSQYELWENFVERIMPGAFDRALRDKHDVRGLFNHDANQVLGRTGAGTMRLSVDDTGLRYEIDPGDTTAGRDTVENLDRGDVDGSSFSFIPTVVTTREEGDFVVREITDVDLFDVGPVTFPAYEGTSAMARSLLPETVRAGLVEFRAQRAKENDPPADPPITASGLAVGDTVTWWIEDATRMSAEPEMGEVQQIAADGELAIPGTSLKLKATAEAPAALVACDCSSDETGEGQTLYLVPVSKLTKVIVQSKDSMEEDYERQRERDLVNSRAQEIFERMRV